MAALKAPKRFDQLKRKSDFKRLFDENGFATAECRAMLELEWRDGDAGFIGPVAPPMFLAMTQPNYPTLAEGQTHENS